MHLLKAQPGGFVDEEGIIDLEQTPAPIVVLSAADSSLAALAQAVEALPADFPDVRLANWMQLLKPAAFDLYRSAVLDKAQVVVVSLLGGSSYWQYGVEMLEEWLKAARPSRPRHLIVVSGDDSVDPELEALSSLDAESTHRIWRYFREGGFANSQQLFHYLADTCLDHNAEWQEPQPLPRCMLYLPNSPYPQASFSEWQQRWQAHDNVCAVLFYRSHLQSGNTGMFDQLITQLEAHGLQPLPIAVASLKDPESIALVNALIEQSDAKIILNTTGFASNTVASPDLSAEPTTFQSPFARKIPVLQLILSSSTRDDWESYTQGLRSRDIAMQVVLPEMDGRIITRAISFKAESRFSERAQISVISYQLHQERADFIAQLARNYIRLTLKTNRQKRIALILANYPTKDGRIGNGVGLDTPASTINLLNAMAAADYPVSNIPEDGTALINELLGAVTNNPNTLHTLPCWQSLAIDEYMRYFQQLPEANQKAVWERWGPPENDPKHRQGRIMLAGMRLGETFIGIQPARGFNMDLQANYHDPDLVPPHSYLAYYFWLRHTYQVDAIIHVGKHGNLEWLPGKGVAMSEQCWPDVALGPMPHFYPFIVNDPGEGSQAKRRTQAVIIDHLMPPMTRAETYGDLAQLEGLVDEYYQAMGMDVRRETWLREQILEQVKSTNVLQELAVVDSDEEAVFDALDTYLCDIKEAQIRHGLHILGALPNTAKLADTIVALLRLPRGTQPHSRGILHAIAHDLELDYDASDLNAKAWHGNRPKLLQQLTDDAWRTHADTRERLELLAQQWVTHYVLQYTQNHTDASVSTRANDEYESWSDFHTSYPQTAAILNYARQTLLVALHTSVKQETQALIDGLSGQFIEPGPSGAPTRGRLDTLPTGRNFFSVDNRSIPSPAAWALGQKSAQALIERHLQDHGDYPRQLGLSVWGTATMRTGGDDIAQAFALMGIKPVWAEGSHRVIDFEILSNQLLGRPRVDVTLRVSGFFRDAFPNVIKLYDAAIQALAAYDEAPEINSIRAHIEQQTKTLISDGMSVEDAKQQASYRVFGSKPGAYGAGLQGLIDERCWETRDDLADAYLNWGGYAYGNTAGDGVEARDAFANRLGQLEAVVQNQDNREHDLLDSDDYYQFQGGMTNAVTSLSGQAPAVYHNDHSDPERPKVRTLKEELNRVIRSRLLNPKWIEGMREHGYKGAFEMAASVDYLFAYDATTNLIADYQYEAVSDALVFDEENRAFLEEHNPAALEEMAERLLEAAQRGLWGESDEYKERLRGVLLEIDEGAESQKQPDSIKI
ncbi:cobaltochelatase subunit CobN [Leucothrix arctica]|uniref:Cobaltochelatase subunit CobN n=1 Tax=Leucothrix arctica TaxID=1481894 RepID=A0A317CB19_9GAMM|nr:cobaltochelatase subunit CobN [Leucothrix arctica]PWQ95557.1 cobaltochelatase subunit CobN [Leucothrix arctica]